MKNSLLRFAYIIAILVMLIVTVYNVYRNIENSEKIEELQHELELKNNSIEDYEIRLDLYSQDTEDMRKYCDAMWWENYYHHVDGCEGECEFEYYE